ncbi:hypothetical protein EIN_413810 [Entamoeba invadens IP1]|uniref:Uncharacterized protein n=1 Tax=Entamoeba invadens IP1 TaxID=370355 RepID=L7FNA6_ENTIV|nr:hypothetical protein EIN_447400 [Entamoeba invadens IP1]XP_004258474.1 hypothetical protein EIN_413810 [Entamoeba invadens IP1]ELP89079.1 hypothetical protein EIN_447400 [Entamoeba invadens IP1]ELP91703.1 hypothetical protein EIN_413810 [Entamoeba invadens IP1]|eukprot:XP_004255850.1 hypothetical protein EIN_447400 [Entamoeba invadens IP1]
MEYTEVPIDTQTQSQNYIPQNSYPIPPQNAHYQVVQQVQTIPLVTQNSSQEDTHIVTKVLYLIGWVFPVIWMVQLFFIFSSNQSIKIWGYRALSALLLYGFVAFMSCYLVFQSAYYNCYYDRY